MLNYKLVLTELKNKTSFNHLIQQTSKAEPNLIMKFTQLTVTQSAMISTIY